VLASSTAKRFMIALLALVALAITVIAICVGPVSVPAGKVFAALTGQTASLTIIERAVIVDIRLPRAIAALAVGAVLGICGAAMQGLFRNPLADPGLVGVTSGASVGSVLYLKFGATVLAGFSALLGNFALPVAAFAGGLATTWLMYRSAQVAGRTVISLMLLAGVAINALGAALIGLVLFFSDDDQLRQFTFWTLGNVGHASWTKLAAAAPLLLACVAAALRHARPLNAFLLGEAEAGHLGVNLQRAKNSLIFATAAGVGAATSIAGGIGFVGLVVPHVMRLAFGPDHRWLLPASALGGAALLCAADLFARTAAAPAELPIGVITAIFGAPVFFALLQSQRKTSFT
jgi:iron complex transport system permease protein